MADRNDEVMGHLALTISVVYSLLVDVCAMLPVPIGLPISQHIPAELAVPAIQRVTEVAPDQPMGELQLAQLHTGCIHLLAAIDLYALCGARYMDTRAEGVAANLLYGEEALRHLEVWLVINQAD
ncbi:hypothetical protein WB388_08690 [Streptomyces brasiliscabiei]|uniref:Uncharacterized protein n=1 Tax=Streptomyces brasiliscabiei TaxID=2736302 RepID=A0ABU8G9T1_9ACTN